MNSETESRDINTLSVKLHTEIRKDSEYDYVVSQYEGDDQKAHENLTSEKPNQDQEIIDQHGGMYGHQVEALNTGVPKDDGEVIAISKPTVYHLKVIERDGEYYGQFYIGDEFDGEDRPLEVSGEEAAQEEAELLLDELAYRH